MNTFKSSLASVICLLLSMQSAQAQMRYGETLCNLPEYFCMKIKSGDSWDRLFPNIEEQDIVRRINRMNIRLKPGMIIAVPKNIERLTIYDVSPFPRYIEPSGEKTIYVSQKNWHGELMMKTVNCFGGDQYHQVLENVK